MKFISGDTELLVMVVQALRKEPLTVYGDGKQTRSFQYVSDLVSSPFQMHHHKSIYYFFKLLSMKHMFAHMVSSIIRPRFQHNRLLISRDSKRCTILLLLAIYAIMHHLCW